MGIKIRNGARNCLVVFKEICPLLVVAFFLFTALPSWATPSAPSNLKRTYISGSRIDIAWDASTDSGGVSGYRIYNADTATLLATTNLTSYSFTGLDSTTTYRYYVEAYNGVGEVSAMSHTITVWGPRPLPVSTPVGSNVQASFNYLTVTFAHVTSAGETSLTSYEPPGPPPTGLSFPGNPDIPGELLVNDIGTTAIYTGPVIVSHPYNPAFGSPRLFHWENGSWHDVTLSVNTADNTITGRVTSLSPFGMGYYSSSGGGSGSGSSSRGTGANENMIAFAILAILAGTLLLRRHRRFRKA